MNPPRSHILRTLAERIQEIQASGFSQKRSTHSLGVAALDALLPGRGLPAGSLVELLSASEGAGVWTLALFMGRQVAGERNGLVVVDSQGSFYPPAAAKLGLELSHTILVRPRTPSEANTACEEALRCSAVGAVIGWHQQMRAREFRRLQLSAEAGGGVGFVLRPAGAVSVPSFAVLRLLVSPVASGAGGEKGVGILLCEAPSGPFRQKGPDPFFPPQLRRVRVQVVRCRGGKAGQSLLLEIDDETGHVHSPAEVAAATPGTRTARAAE
jgi:protein ImuA